jgi:myotubularin-related protein 3/4
VLVEKEWLSFGHKFGDRCGNGTKSEDTNERCPVFLQWIDCIQQIHHQFPCSFEFSTGYLIKLAQHVHSCLFGTFLCNTLKERLENSIPNRTYSVWPFLSAPIYKNPLYQPNRYKVIWPNHNVRCLEFWSDFYLGSFHTPQLNGHLEISSDKIYTENGMIKTRSFDDLVSEIKSKDPVPLRRLSDPSIVFGDKNMPLTVSIFQENNSSELSPSCKSTQENGFDDEPLHQHTEEVDKYETEAENNEDEREEEIKDDKEMKESIKSDDTIKNENSESESTNQEIANIPSEENDDIKSRDESDSSEKVS